MKSSQSTPKSQRSKSLGLLTLPLLLTALFTVVLDPPVAHATTYHVTTAVSARSTATAAATGVAGIPAGGAFDVVCQQIGEPVGPKNNTLYFWVAYQGRNFFVPDTWTDSPHLAGQPPIAGIPMCATSPPPATDTRIWVGAPFNGKWVPINSDCAGAVFPASCSRPAVHHWLSSAAAPSGDWAVDLGAAASTPVVLYAAPEAATFQITAKVDRVRAACASGVLSKGGWAVTVGFYSGTIRVGSATYAHIEPSVREGQTISRWGTTLGTIGSYTNNSCWQGAHLHFQLYSEKNYACFNKGWADKAPISATNFLGFTGGNVASGARKACA